MAEYILEAFKQFDLLEEAEESAEFSMNPDDLQDMKTFIDMASGEDEEVDVFDLEAETKEELKDAYVGKVILDCNVCHSNIFYNKEDIEIGDDEIANIGDECPYCMSNEGYTIIGEIKKFGEEEPEDEFEEPEDDIEDIDMEEEPAEDIEVEDEEEFMEEEYLKSSDKLAASKKLKEGVNKSRRRKLDEGISYGGIWEIGGIGLRRHLKFDSFEDLPPNVKKVCQATGCTELPDGIDVFEGKEGKDEYGDDNYWLENYGLLTGYKVDSHDIILALPDEEQDAVYKSMDAFVQKLQEETGLSPISWHKHNFYIPAEPGAIEKYFSAATTPKQSSKTNKTETSKKSFPRDPEYFHYVVYELDEDGDEVDPLKDFEDFNKALKFAQKSGVKTHICLVPTMDPDDDPDWADEFENAAHPYDAYEVVWESEEDVNESLKADKSPSLKRDDRINGRKTSLKRTLDGSDEIRGPKYKELDESKKRINESIEDFEIPGVEAELLDDWEDAGHHGYEVAYTKDGEEICTAEIWGDDSPVTIYEQPSHLFNRTYDNFNAFASDMEYKLDSYFNESLKEARKNTPAKYKKTGDDIYRKNTEKVEYVVQSSLEDDPDIKVTSESEAKALIAQNKREDKKDPDRKAAGITYSYKKIEESYDEANDVMTPEEAKAYWQENRYEDPILAEYDSYQDWFKVSKENGYIKELDEAIAPLDKGFLFKHYKEVTPKELHDDYMGPTPARLNKESAENVFPGDFEHISWLALAKESRSAIFKAGRSADLDYLELVRDTYNGDNTERLVHAGIKNGKPTIFYVDESEIKKILGDIKESLSEAIEDVSITTEDETMTMTTKEDGGVVVETSPKEAVATAGEELEGEEVIAPLDMDTQEEIEAQDDFNDEFADDIEEVTGEEEVAEDDFDMPMDDFDEESFDELGESYLKECYENVDSFKTSTVKNSDGKLVVEGLIKFNSGNTKATTFTFESMAISKKGKIKLIGENAQICSGKKAFKVRGKVEDNRFISESLNYNYNAKNDDNESVKVSGTVRRK